MEVEFQLVAVHGEKITAKAMFELLPVRRPILSVSRLVEQRFAVFMGNDLGNKMSKNGREIHFHKSNGVYHVRSSALSELCLLEEQEPRNDVGPPGVVGQAAAPWTRRLPYQSTDDEGTSQMVSHLSLRAWCSHCVKGLARDWLHRSDSEASMVAIDCIHCVR